MEYFAMIVMAIAVLIGLQFTKEKDITRIEWSAVSQFIGFMIVVTVLRTWVVDFLMQAKIIEFLPTIPYEIASHKWTFGLVFWEDVFFGIPLYFIGKHVKNKWTKFSLAVIITILFAMGHGYQGWSGILFASLYPWFISKSYGEKYGFGTVMICHIMYDSFTCLWLIVLPYLGVGRIWFHL
mgnify:CR=1 FL=1